MNANQTDKLIANAELAEIMARASNATRAEETASARRAHELYRENEAYVKEYFQTYRKNPAIWSDYNSLVYKIGNLRVDAEALETSALLMHLWVNGGWSEEEWESTFIHTLQEEGEEHRNREKTRDVCCKAALEAKTYCRPCEDIKHAFLRRRFGDIRESISFLHELAEIGTQLRAGERPNPIESTYSKPAIAALAAWYYQRHA